MKRPRERPYGSGSLFEHDGRWMFTRSFMENGKRVRRGVSGATREEALAKAEARTDWGPSQKKLARLEARRREELRLEREALRRARSERHAADHAIARERKGRAQAYARRVIEFGLAQGWSTGHIADVVIAQLTPNRVRRGIFGPCSYCGTWMATDVDHIIPTTRGGTDEADNLTSACKPCNSRKRTRTPEEWVAA